MLKLFFVFLSILAFIGCELNENQATLINSIDSSNLLGESCTLPEDEELTTENLQLLCRSQQSCQEVLNEDEQFIGCVPVPEENEEELPESDQEEDQIASQENDEEESDHDNDHDDQDEDEDSEKSTKYSCCQNDDDDDDQQSHKLLICHKGKFMKRHKTMCVPRFFWHLIMNNGKSYEGACRRKDLD